MRLGSNGVDWERSYQKIPTRLHGTNFCTTSACFARSLVRQTNGSKCTQIVRNTPKHEFRSQRGQSGVFVEKNSDTTSWHKLLHQFNPFCTEFCKAIKRSQMHPNSNTHQSMSLGPNGVNRVCSLQKIMTQLCGMNFCTSSAYFALCFLRQPNSPECI